MRIKLCYKSKSYVQWAQEISSFAASYELQRQLEYWKNVCKKISPIRVEHTATWPLFADVKENSLKINESLTSELLKQTHRAYNTRIDDKRRRDFYEYKYQY